MSRPGIAIVWTWCFLSIMGSSLPPQDTELSGKIAFLKEGEVWVSDLGRREMKQITSDSGKVDDFLFSPSLHDLAYSRILRYEDEPGLWDDTEEVPQRPVCSIAIMDLMTWKIVKRIMPTEDTWIYISQWLPEGRLLYYGSSGFDVSGFYTFDSRSDIREEVDYNKSAILRQTEYSSDGTMRVYVNDSGLGKDFRQNLHLVDLKTNVSRILVSKRSIADCQISNDRNQIAFVEVEEIGKKYYDNLWIYRIQEDSLTVLYKGPAKAKTGNVNQISWSPDDRHVGMFYPPEALVVEVEHPNHTYQIRGADFSWIHSGTIVFDLGNGIYLYNLETRKSEMWLAGATKPAFLSRKGY